jgi:nitrogen-specific signal transduction histidine kinase
MRADDLRFFALFDGLTGGQLTERIVAERHGGTITIDSRPGQTVLRVRLPARPGRLS